MVTHGVPGTEARDTRGIKIKHATFHSEKHVDGVLVYYTQKVVNGIWQVPKSGSVIDTVKLPIWFGGKVERECKLSGIIDDKYLTSQIKGIK